jgi:streptomycin 6-kinase
LYAELLPSQEAQVVLHGDLHHYNILSSGDQWKAIDPKGVIGEPVYETGALLRNPFGLLDRPNPLKLTERRIAILSELLGFDR